MAERWGAGGEESDPRDMWLWKASPGRWYAVYVETQRVRRSADLDMESSKDDAPSGRGLDLRKRKAKGRML